MSNINEEKSSIFVITGEFNARCNNWWSQNIANSQGSIIGTLTFASRYHKLTSSSTHMTNTSSSCIDLFFTSSTSLVTPHII